MKRVRALIIVGALASLAVPLTTASANEFAGIVSNEAFVAETFQRSSLFGRMDGLGIGMIRQTFTWASIEGRRNSYNFTNYDDFVMRAAQHNIRVLPILF